MAGPVALFAWKKIVSDKMLQHKQTETPKASATHTLKLTNSVMGGSKASAKESEANSLLDSLCREFDFMFLYVIE